MLLGLIPAASTLQLLALETWNQNNKIINIHMKTKCDSNLYFSHTENIYLSYSLLALASNIELVCKSWLRCTVVLLVLVPEASFGLRVLSLPLSVHRSVCPSLTNFVRVITHHPFKLGSPNSDKRCKTTWLWSLLFWGAINLDLQGQI